MNCLQNIITPLNPCAGSVPCKQIYNAKCVQYDGILPCLPGVVNPALDYILEVFCHGISNLSVCPTYSVMTLTNGVVNVSPVQNKAQISTPDNCGIIRFKGASLMQTVTLNSPSSSFETVGDANVATGGGALYTLGATELPIQLVSFSFIGAIANDFGSRVGLAIDNVTGQIGLVVNSTTVFPAGTDLHILFSLDSISYSTV